MRPATTDLNPDIPQHPGLIDPTPHPDLRGHGHGHRYGRGSNRYDLIRR